MDKFAVIETGGKQYLVKPGDSIKIDPIQIPCEGDFLSFDKVLLRAENKEIKIGKPYIKDASVKAKLEKEGKYKKIKILRYHSKTRLRKRKGHKQPYIQVKIEEIN